MALASVDMLTGAASGVHVLAGTEGDVAAAINVLETGTPHVDVRGDGADRRVAVGAGSSASGDSGADASPRYQAVAVGAGASASGPSSVAVGGGAAASAADAVQLGAGVNTTQKALKFRGAVLFVVASDGDSVVAALGSGFPTASATAPGAVKVGANISVGPDGTISVAAVPTKVSDLANDSGFVTQASVPTKVSELTNDSGFVTQAAVPTKVSELTNDSGFVTQASVPTKVSELENDRGFVASRTVQVCRVALEGESDPFTCTRFSETEWRFLYGGTLQYIRHLTASGRWEFGFITGSGNYNVLDSVDGSADAAVVSFPTGVTATFTEEADPVAYASQVPPSLVQEAVVSSDGSQLTLMLSNGSAVVFSGGVQERIAGSDGRFIKYDGTIRVVGATVWLYSRESFVDVPSVQFGPDEWRWDPASVGDIPSAAMEYYYLRYVDGKWEHGYGHHDTATDADVYMAWRDLGTDRAATTLSYSRVTFRYSETLVDKNLATADQVSVKADKSELEDYVACNAQSTVGSSFSVKYTAGTGEGDDFSFGIGSGPSGKTFLVDKLYCSGKNRFFADGIVLVNETSAEGASILSKITEYGGDFKSALTEVKGLLAYSRNATGLKDRAFNTLSFDGTEFNLSTALEAVTPTASGQPRDLLIVATATAATTISFTAGTIKGDKPTIDGSGTWLITLTEYASGVWYCRQIKMEDAA